MNMGENLVLLTKGDLLRLKKPPSSFLSPEMYTGKKHPLVSFIIMCKNLMCPIHNE